MARVAAGVLLCCCVLALATCVATSMPLADSIGSLIPSHPAPPQWPGAYQLSMDLEVPYVTRIQKQGLTYKVKVWRDEDQGLLKVVGQEESCSIENVNENERFYITPEDGKLGCFSDHMESPDGPSLAASAALNGRTLTATLPDLSLPQWHYNGTRTVGAVEVHVWRRVQSEDYGYGTVVTDWQFSATAAGVPVRLYMRGVNWFGSHYDEYIATYHDYTPGPVDPKAFRVPQVCRKGARPAPSLILHHLLHAQLGAMMPPQHHGDEEYDSFVRRHRRHHASGADYLRRKQHYYANKAAIDAHNLKANRTFSQALNRFADWSRDEFRAFVKMGGQGGAPALGTTLKPHQLARHKPSLPQHMLPKTVDWRGTGADSPVKDQGVCGSCWAFGSVAPMEAAFFRAFGRQQLLSEQFLMDCSWAFGNSGCLGGYQDYGLSFAVNSFGIPAEEDYPYIGTNGWCNTSVPRAAAFKRVVQVEAGKEWHLMEALLTKGPMTVSIDASADSFMFYSKGVYSEPGCATRAGDLDHAVVVSGYGTDEQGRDYWLVKNTWSPLWGEQGYIRVARTPNDCGVASQPFYMELDTHATRSVTKQRAGGKQ